MKINGNEITIGDVIDHQGALLRVVNVQHVKPGKGGAFAQVELKDIRTEQKIQERFRTDEKLTRVRLQQQQFQFLYAKNEEFTFMNVETFEQLTLTQDVIGAQSLYLEHQKESLVVEIEFHDNIVVGVKIPEKISCLIVGADVVVKGQTVSSSYKPAILENGLKILVPPHIEVGTRIVVNTKTAEYVARDKQ